MSSDGTHFDRLMVTVSLCTFSFFPAVEFFVVVELYGGGVFYPEGGVDVRRNARQWLT